MRHFSIIGGAIFFMAASASYADIGGIGSPVVPSNATPPINAMPDAKTAPPTTAANPGNGSFEDSNAPLLVIQFTQKRVFYERQLKQAIDRSEANQASANYYIVSRVPVSNGKLENERLNKSYSDNVGEVEAKMQEFGVPANRIHASTETSDQITSQEISIVVK